MSDMKNALDGINIRLAITEEINSDLEDIATETIQSKIQREREV